MSRLDKLRHLYAAVGEEIEREENRLIREQRLTSEIPYIDDTEKPDREAPPCGSEPGYQHHLYVGEETDAACRAAHNMVNQIRYARRCQEAS